VSAQQPASRLEQSPQKGGRDGKGRVGDDVVAAAGQAELSGIDSNDADMVAESPSQVARSVGVDLDRHDSRPRVDERCGDYSESRADVEDDRPWR
jgi:hypothetical protein